MELISINKRKQDSDTENPMLIHGECLTWEVQVIKIWRGYSFSEWLNKQSERYDIKYFLLYDIKSMKDHFCDQGCVAGMGCKKKWVEDDHTLIVEYSIILN